MKLGQLARSDQYWITPRYEKYIQNRDLVNEAHHASAILSRPERDRAVGWSASSAGTCLRAQVYKSRRAEASPTGSGTQRIFQNGHYVHLRHQTAGLSAGYLTAVEVDLTIPELNVKGTMDGRTSEDEIAEYKSINPFGYKQVQQFGPKYEHKRQVTAYMQASGLRSARIVYEDKATNQLEEFHFTYDEELADLNVSDWRSMNEHVAQGTLPDMLEPCKQKEGPYKWCPYAEVCMSDRKKEHRGFRIRRTSSSEGD